jgi:hypothetical protein
LRAPHPFWHQPEREAPLDHPRYHGSRFVRAASRTAREPRSPRAGAAQRCAGTSASRPMGRRSGCPMGHPERAAVSSAKPGENAGSR